MAVIKCPDCGKSLKVGDNVGGKRVRCPGCKNPFVVPEDAPVLELVDEEEEQEERVTKRPQREAERRLKACRDDDEEEEEDRSRRRRSRDDISVSSAPLVYAILSCFLSCAPLIGYILGRLAMSNADAELQRLPSGKRYRDARKRLELARTIGIVGMCLSGVMLVVAIVLGIVSGKK